MNKKYSYLFLSCTCFAFAALYGDGAQAEIPTSAEYQNNPPPPAVVEKQLKDAEAEFAKAKKMFNPWYTGPLITPSPHLIPPGLINIQPYLFYTDNYAHFDKHAESHDIPDLHTIKGLAAIQFGIVKWMDGILIVQGQQNRQEGRVAAHLGDTSLSLGFPLMVETAYHPAILFSVGESFPTGKYQKLDHKKAGIEATGSGAFETTLSLGIGKVVWWVLTHPMAFRASFNYTFPCIAHVRGFNAYGGGFGTSGRAHIGSAIAADFGYEYSFTQRWVFALDLVYTYSAEVTFHGQRGVNAMGAPVSVGAPFNDQFSLAPALEYNVNENLGFIVGGWFAVWGRNSLEFASGVASFTYTF